MSIKNCKFIFWKNNMSLKKEREERWFLYQFTNEKLFEEYNKWGKSFYLGIDPSASSLQMWNLCAMMAAVNLMKKWNKCYFLVGGATGMIWDPSGKDAERNFLDETTLRNNQDNIFKQIISFLNSLKENYNIEFEYEMVNNYDFYKWMWFLDFLRDVGKYITINTMAAKESVKKRLEDPDKSISYSEFSYMLIQGYDFMHLYENMGVELQLWWSDQWWNIVTGMELTRKKYNKELFGLTIPIITDSSGKKFGKSEWNAIWLDPNKNSPYFVYQYFLNTNDDDISKYMKILTLMSIEEIENVIIEHKKDPWLRFWQKKLAEYVVELIFGKKEMEHVNKITEILFGNENKLELIKKLDKDAIMALKSATGGAEMDEIGDWIKILDLCTLSWLTASNGEAKKMIQSGAIYCNEEKIDDLQKIFTKEDDVNGIFLLRKGKKVYKTVFVK